MGRICIILIPCLIAAIAQSLIVGPALAGTETGEFCPTCPDWTNLEGWLAKKDAYERAQQNGVQQQPAAVSTGATSQAGTSAKKAEPMYPKADIIANAGSSFDGLVVLDVRDPEDYRHGHIPGSRNLYWEELSPDDSLDAALAERMLEAAGINNSDSLLIYGDDDEGADYVFWALSYLGHGSLKKLDGGVDAAWSAGIEPDSYIPLVGESNYTVHIVPWQLVDRDGLGSMLEQPEQHHVQILDARDFADYGMSRLTNASIPMTAEKLYEDLEIKDAATLEELLLRRGLDKNSTQLVYGTPEAYSLFFGLKLMGYNATLLQGDWWQKTQWAVRNVR